MLSIIGVIKFVFCLNSTRKSGSVICTYVYEVKEQLILTLLT